MGCYFLLVFLAFLGVVQVSLSLNEAYRRNFITWDDIQVDWRKLWLNTGENFNHTRLIIVDKNGAGHSATVQGAVDMVPENNAERVKIYILPGIYRCFSLAFLQCSLFLFLSFFF